VADNLRVEELKTTQMAHTYQFKIILADSDPMIWRTFQVPGEYRMDRFHQVLQIVMGWNNAHLHEFRINGRTVGMVADCEYDFIVEDETKFRLSDFNLKERDTLSYLYDFGDHWEHIIHLDRVSNQKATSPFCTNGKGACPPDDCGGVFGYTELLEVLADPKHPEYEGWKNWLPEGFQPDKFPLDEVSKELKEFGAWNIKHPRKKSTPWHQI
jgi:hypothetical protein